MPDYLKTWRSINQAGGPTEPVRSHFLQPQAKISPNKGLNRIDTPIPEDEPLADLNLNSFIRNRVPGANTAMDFLSDPSNLETGGANNAISWFGTKAAREASGDNLIKIAWASHQSCTFQAALPLKSAGNLKFLKFCKAVPVLKQKLEKFIYCFHKRVRINTKLRI